MKVIKLTNVKNEAADMKTLYFLDKECSMAKPGQYVMIWIPGVDEVPMSLSTIGLNSPCSITVQPVGEASNILCKMSPGNRLGVRGPLGNGYEITGKKPLIVAGGTGVASLKPLAELMKKKGIHPTFVLGAMSYDLLVFREMLEKLLGEGLILSTNDGTCGFKGDASECATQLLKKGGFDSVYTCGPERMMVKVYEEAEKRGLPIQISLERYIKCAVGLCASCVIGPYRVCKDGPVFNLNQLRVIQNEFGIRRMDPSGRPISVQRTGRAQ